jgi:hypothetical protein
MRVGSISAAAAAAILTVPAARHGSCRSAADTVRMGPVQLAGQRHRLQHEPQRRVGADQEPRHQDPHPNWLDRPRPPAPRVHVPQLQAWARPYGSHPHRLRHGHLDEPLLGCRLVGLERHRRQGRAPHTERTPRRHLFVGRRLWYQVLRLTPRQAFSRKNALVQGYPKSG